MNISLIGWIIVSAGLGFAGVTGTDWQFWVVMFGVFFIQITSYFRGKAEAE